MLPPVDDDLLRDNPEFAALYSTLTHVVLNADGSTRHDPAAKQRAAVREELDALRLSTAKHRIIERAVAATPPPEPRPEARAGPGPARPLRSRRRPDERTAPQPDAPPDAPPDVPPDAPPDVPPDAPPDALADLVLLLPSLLDAEAALAPDAAALLLASPPLADLDALLPPLAGLVSSTLHDWALSLARSAHPATNPSFLHQHIASLPQDYADLVGRHAAARQSLAAARLRVQASLSQLLRRHTQALVLLVRSLEAKHGVVARSVELRASHVSLRAQRLDLEAAQVARGVAKEIYSPPAVAALQNYANHLKDAKLRATERVRSLEAELASYGVGGAGDAGREKTMREMARVYCEMTKQMEDLNQDLDRLRGE